MASTQASIEVKVFFSVRIPVRFPRYHHFTSTTVLTQASPEEQATGALERCTDTTQDAATPKAVASSFGQVQPEYRVTNIGMQNCSHPRLSAETT